jgi:hypothetical protein
VPRGAAQDTLLANYNDLASVRALFAGNPGQIAAVIVEPVAANMGVVPPEPGFLEGLRALCTKEGALLVFDEVITGFRLAPGGAAEYFGVTPDLYTFGKIIGGGMPVGAYGGSRALMEQVSPLGGVYQAGTPLGQPRGHGGGARDAGPARGEPRAPTRGWRRRQDGWPRGCARRCPAARSTRSARFFWRVSFSGAGAAGRPGWPGGIRRLVRPSGGRFFPLVRKESEERHAKGKGFAQSRPSLWNPILRNLRAAFALQITVREPGLRPCRAIVICVGNRGGGKPPPYEDTRHQSVGADSIRPWGRAEFRIGRRERS